MTDPLPHSAVPSTRRGRMAAPWGIWATIGWIVLAVGASLVVALVATMIAAWQGDESPLSLYSESGFVYLGSISLAMTLVIGAILASAIRLSGLSFTDYLALRLPALRWTLIGLAAMIACMTLAGLLLPEGSEHIADKSTTDLFAAARNAGLLPAFIAYVVIGAPLCEEWLFRGFMFRGFAAKGGPVFAIASSAATWAVLHLQYDAVVMIYIFALGCVLGALRYKSGSTILTIGLHGFNNAAAVIGVFLMEAGVLPGS